MGSMNDERENKGLKRILDSGNRQKFETGAVRDISEGKGRCDLLPLDVVGEILNLQNTHTYCLLTLIEDFKNTKNVNYLGDALKAFIGSSQVALCDAMLEVSIHFEEGAKKYGENNWKKGIPLHCYLDSAVRHYLKHLRGDTDERHDRAFVWNLLCAIWTLNNKPELDDVEKDI